MRPAMLYGKLGGRMAFPDADNYYDPQLFRWEPVDMLKQLAEARPDVDFIVISAHDGSPRSLGLDNVRSAHELHATTKLVDLEPHLIRWVSARDSEVINIINWVGVNAVSQEVPKLDGSGNVKPLESDRWNTAPLVRIINAWRDVDPRGRQETWLWPDARYHLKVRDLKWPITKPVIAQMDIDINMKLHRYGDQSDPDGWPAEWATGKRQTDRTDWVQAVPYRYRGLETIMCRELPTMPLDESRLDAPLLVANEVKRCPRREEIAEWASANPGRVRVVGNWPSYGYCAVPNNELLPLMAQYKVTVLPSLLPRRGMVTAKYWEAIKAGCVPVAAPGYDEQHHVEIPYRPRTYDELMLNCVAAARWWSTPMFQQWRANKLHVLEWTAQRCVQDTASC